MTEDRFDMLTKVGAGSPMGSFMREHWVPALPSHLLIADGDPRRVRLLGENLVAFRDTDGHVGVLDEACPHRGVSLALARNEDCGLRCLYHGWKLDVEGRVVDTPNESANIANFASRVKSNHYPVEEAGGIVWVYLGTRETPPVRPRLPFTELAEDQVFVSYARLEANWLPVLEAGLDQVHVRVLHQSSIRTNYEGAAMSSLMLDKSTRIRFDVQRAPHGFTWRYLGVQDPPAEHEELRVGSFVLPWFNLFAPVSGAEGDESALLVVPADDGAAYLWGIFYNVSGPLEGDGDAQTFIRHVESEETYRTRFPHDPESKWGQDREAMDRHWTGLGMDRGGVGIFLEDVALLESIPHDFDRAKENLGPNDAVITRTRHALFAAVEAHQKGEELPSVESDHADVLPRYSGT